MSKMNELSQALDEMIACGEGMIKAANAIKDIFSSTEEAPEETKTKPAKKVTKAPETAKADEAPEPIYTKEDVRAVLASKAAAGYKKEVKELLEKYGAQQLKQVNPDDYAAILKEAEVIGNA
ncbi:DNA ligase [Lachnospiraceae bacterium HCP1S3_A8]